jgi:hypothetical protein
MFVPIHKARTRANLSGSEGAITSRAFNEADSSASVHRELAASLRHPNELSHPASLAVHADPGSSPTSLFRASEKYLALTIFPYFWGAMDLTKADIESFDFLSFTRRPDVLICFEIEKLKPGGAAMLSNAVILPI